MSDPRLGALRAEFKALTGKAPSPRLAADALAAKLETVKAEKAAAAPAPPSPPEAPPAADAAEAPPAADAAAEAAPAAPEAPPAPAPAEPAPKAAKRGKASEPAVAPAGCVYLRHPEGIGASYAGVELVADDEGRVLAPAEAAADLAAHGFEAL